MEGTVGGEEEGEMGREEEEEEGEMAAINSPCTT
jgi:hypothetical protein